MKNESHSANFTFKKLSCHLTPRHKIQRYELYHRLTNQKLRRQNSNTFNRKKVIWVKKGESFTGKKKKRVSGLWNTKLLGKHVVGDGKTTLSSIVNFNCITQNYFFFLNKVVISERLSVYASFFFFFFMHWYVCWKIKKIMDHIGERLFTFFQKWRWNVLPKINVDEISSTHQK